MIISEQNHINTGMLIPTQKTTESPRPAQQAAFQDTVVLSERSKAMSQAWQEIADKYNVTNISQTEVSQLGKELRANGMITANEHLILSAPHSINQDISLKYNFLEEFQSHLDFLKTTQSLISNDERAAYENLSSVLNSLYNAAL